MFQFKQFAVDQSNCAMKINTDGVLLGAMADTNEPNQLLDIGAGTGVIALMLAQRFNNSKIDAVEIDVLAAHTAQSNFANSPFANHLTVHPESFESFFKQHAENRYDLIVSNPPFYINSLESPKANKTVAKHTDKHFFEVIIAAVFNHLTDKGLFWVILPVQTALLVKPIAVQNKLYLHKIINIYSFPDVVPHREVLVFGFHQQNIIEEKFVIYQQPNIYSEAYKALLKDFLTIF
jgi:tRNA1Val (adenine37-N6)-methyltransferase